MCHCKYAEELAPRHTVYSGIVNVFNKRSFWNLYCKNVSFERPKPIPGFFNAPNRSLLARRLLLKS